MRPILAPGGRIRAYLKEIGNRTELIAPGGRVLGYYDGEKDQTILPGGRFYGHGNQLMALLAD